MRHLLGIKMEVMCKTAEVLSAVKQNRQNHQEIVKEADKLKVCVEDIRVVQKTDCESVQARRKSGSSNR